MTDDSDAPVAQPVAQPVRASRSWSWRSALPYLVCGLYGAGLGAIVTGYVWFGLALACFATAAVFA